MLYNIIGPPGSGKTTYIRARFGFSPPMQVIDDEVFESFRDRKVFEHTGLNPRINQFLAASDEPITTIRLQTGIARCTYRILNDFFCRRTTLKQTGSRLNILCYYYKHRSDIYQPPGPVKYEPGTWT